MRHINFEQTFFKSLINVTESNVGTSYVQFEKQALKFLKRPYLSTQLLIRHFKKPSYPTWVIRLEFITRHIKFLLNNEIMRARKK